MFAFDIAASCISVSVCGILYYYLEAIDPDVNWGPAVSMNVWVGL